MQTKICKRCKKEKPYDEFHKRARYAGGIYTVCVTCEREVGKIYRKSEKDRGINRWAIKMAVPGAKEAHNERKRKIRTENPDIIRAQENCRYKREYGITLDRFEEEIRKQGGQCKICQEKKSRLCADHDHETGQFRSALCVHCNVLVGRLERNPNLINRLQEYLREIHERKLTLYQC